MQRPSEILSESGFSGLAEWVVSDDVRSAAGRSELPESLVESIRKVVEYMEGDEAKDFVDDPCDDHIYRDVAVLRVYLDSAVSEQQRLF